MSKVKLILAVLISLLPFNDVRVLGYCFSIILANPQIEDPDRVEVGHPIRFPAISTSVVPSSKGGWWVKIA